MLHKAFKYLSVFFIVSTVAVALLPELSSVQAQTQNYSGSDISNYTCANLAGMTLVAPSAATPQPHEVNGNFVCDYSGGGKTETIAAIRKPPTLIVVEYWFIRILYALWAISGIFFTLVLIFLGLQWMTSMGNPMVTADVIKRMRNWFIGFALVFLSYPVLNTVFQSLGLSSSQCYENIQFPGFTFFFPNACTASETK